MRTTVTIDDELYEQALELIGLDQALDLQQRRVHRMHADLCCGATSRSGGVAAVHAARANLQRGAKRQPSGGSTSLGTVPGIASSRCLCSAARSMRGIERISPWVYGWCGRANSSVTGASSTTLPAYITTTRCATSATTPIAWVISITAMPSRFFSSASSSRIWAWIVTSSAVVGSSAISSLGLHASAIAIITRWRIPPENWCG